MKNGGLLCMTRCMGEQRQAGYPNSKGHGQLIPCIFLGVDEDLWLRSKQWQDINLRSRGYTILSGK